MKSTEIRNNILHIDGWPSVGLEEKELQEYFIDNFIFEDDSILEIGYGLGFASNKISSKKPKTHTIVESNKEIYEKAKLEHPNANLFNTRWENLPEDVFVDVDKIIYETTPENSKLEGRELAIEHLRPIKELILNKINKRTIIGLLDPSAELTEKDLKIIFDNKIDAKIIEYPSELVPKNLPWFKNGCNFLYLTKL